MWLDGFSATTTFAGRASATILGSEEAGYDSSTLSRNSLTDLTVRDTRVLLCQRSTGEVLALTEKHHAEARVEASRLRRMGAGRLVADSFGESRWMGAIENTRG